MMITMKIIVDITGLKKTRQLSSFELDDKGTPLTVTRLLLPLLMVTAWLLTQIVPIANLFIVSML